MQVSAEHLPSLLNGVAAVAMRRARPSVRLANSGAPATGRPASQKVWEIRTGAIVHRSRRRRILLLRLGKSLYRASLKESRNLGTAF